MKTLFKSEGLWDFVETEHVESSGYKVRQRNYQKQDAKALFLIQQAVDESLFSRIAAATSAKQAWSLLKTEFQESTKISVANTDHADITVQSLIECLKEGENHAKQLIPSIYMVPSTLKDHNPSSFKPRMVSIGPLHREDEKLQASEVEKAAHVFSLLNRLIDSKSSEAEKKAKQEEILQACARKVNASIGDIRSCYAETITYDNIELAKMMVMDGCFILEFFYRSTKPEDSKSGNMMLPCISFSWGKPTLIMPELDINDFTELVLKNLIAYEQLSADVSQYITSYAMAMDMLIDTQEDIAKLVQSKVVVNHIGSNQEAADMINNICKEVGCKDFFYSDQWEEMNSHYNSSWSKNVAWLRRTYFNNPWNGIALFAGIFLFTLTFIQTFFTVYPAK
ncbi:UPF0481 protein At3g47200-like [Bidens hawaiensis]|uniref:UPF0481 protein At3g47200-like n=1 Tax=Bidens hawaiensis TaxID=980011 RepID=UPI00404B726A